MEEVKNNRLFVVLFFVAFLKSSVCDGANTISANQPLSGDQTIESPGGVFVLGYFKPGRSSNSYIGMWYKVTPTTVVWVANREKPVSDRFSSQLRISDGNLVLLDGNRVPIWSTNVNSTSTTARAVLNDNGNLVLSDGSETLWQSFDNLVDTWLPGAKISYNNVTKTGQRLTSWKNKEDPSPGLYTLELNPVDDSYIILWNETKTYWKSGPWNGEIFSLVPEMRRNYIYDFKFVVTSTERYFTYTVYNTSAIKISRFMINVSGQVQQTNWLVPVGWSLFWSMPRQQCEVYGFCGAYGSCGEKSLQFCQCLHGFDQRAPDSWRIGDFSDGCIRRTRIGCGASGGEPDGFLELPSVSLPENKRSPSAAAESESECRSRCLSDCTCTGFSFEDRVCSVWTGELLNIKQFAVDNGNGKTLFVRVAGSEIVKRRKNKAVVVGAAVALVLALMGIVLLLWRRKRWSVGRGKAVEGSLVAFRYRDLQNATKNFCEKLGGGGFGSVFKGALSDSTAVAVKKLESVSQGEKQFRTEVTTIGSVQHLNLVRLRGFCSEGTHKLLVYDYMPNGSLDSRLFSAGAILDWKTRYQIAMGTARGLHYLHEKCRDCIIHCDIKPENILLDRNLLPKVADFGLAKLVGRDFSRVLTDMRGTRGYLAPEWIAGVAITVKADVYSYGMMLFEVVSGQRNSEQSENGRVKFFPTWAAGVVAGGGNVLGLLDPRLGGNAEVEEVERVCRVACWCVQDEESKRPTMSQVVQILEGVTEVNVPPVPRSLQVFGDTCENVMFFTDGLSSSSSQTSNARRNVSTASSSVTSTT